MRCPLCNAAATRAERGMPYQCTECDWQQRPLADAAPADAPLPPPNPTHLAFGTVATLALLIGPWVLISRLPDLPPLAFPYYLGGMCLYLLGGVFLNPRPDRSDLGYFGGLIDNPFSWSDDYNRFLLQLAILLIPARMAVWTLKALWRVAGRQEPRPPPPRRGSRPPQDRGR